MVLRKGGSVRNDLSFAYGKFHVEIVKFVYFYVWRLFRYISINTSGQVRKAVFTLSKYIQKCVNVQSSHILDLFDTFVLTVLEYGSEVWVLAQANS